MFVDGLSIVSYDCRHSGNVKVFFERFEIFFKTEGYGNPRTIGGSEVFQVRQEGNEPIQPLQGFPVNIIYGMAGMAAVGGGALFIISNRKLKKEAGKGQTGIDPSRLRAYQTSASSGGYQTVRGEAQLIDDADYQKSRSVYDEKSEPKSCTRGTLPKGWKVESK